MEKGKEERFAGEEGRRLRERGVEGKEGRGEVRTHTQLLKTD